MTSNPTSQPRPPQPASARHAIPGGASLSLSLNAKICLTATVLVILSLAATATVTGIRSSHSAEESSMKLARTTALEAAATIQARMTSNLAVAFGQARHPHGRHGADP